MSDTSVYDSLKFLTGAPYNRAMHNNDLLDLYFLRRARQQGFRLPSAMAVDVSNYLGAFVYVPRAGINRNVTYVDLSSLYPNIIRSLNIGPDTIVGTEDELRDSQWTVKDCVWGYIDTRPVKRVEKGESWRRHTDGTYKMIYDPNQNQIRWRDDPVYERCYYLHPDIREGFLRDIVQDLIDLKYQYEGSLYSAIKRVVNSVYGMVSPQGTNNSGRLADWRFGESITLSGRKIIQYTSEQVIEWLQNERNVRGEVYVALGDTDGCGICWPSAPTRDVMLDYVREAVSHLNSRWYEQFIAEAFGVTEAEHYMDVEVESFAPSVFVPAKDPSNPEDDRGVKKRYIQWLTIDDGEEIDEIDFTGLEHERSDVADVTKTVQAEFAEWILQRDRSEAQEHLFPYFREVDERVRTGAYDADSVAKKGGIGQSLSEYGSDSRRPQPLFRGAKYADEHLDVDVGEGSKPLAFYVDYIEHGSDIPTVYTADTAEGNDPVDCIAVPTYSDIPDSVAIDWDRHADKAIREPMAPLLQTIGWSWNEIMHGHSQDSLSSYTPS